MKTLLSRIWRVVRWLLIALAVGFVVLVAWRLKLLYEREDTDAAVAKIHANKLTWDDVFGPLPQEPDKAANDATLAGIDSNENGIRDDVERAIYFKYKDSAKEAAPAFQYAKALQMEFTDVYNSGTLVAVIWEEDRASLCMLDIEKSDEIEGLVINTEMRKQAQEDLYEKYMTTYSMPNKDLCDLDPDSLEN